MPRLARLLVRPDGREPPARPERILIFKGGALGDVLMTTPLVRAVRAAWPQARVSYLVGAWSAPLLAHNPHLDRVIVTEDETLFRRRLGPVRRLADEVRRERFDLGFLLDRHYTAGLFGWLAGIGYRVGFDRDGEGFAHHLRVGVSAPRYDAEYNLDLLRGLGRPAELTPLELTPGPEDESAAAARWSASGLEGTPVIGLAVGGGENPGRTSLFKRWPLEHYRGLLELLHGRAPGARVALFGGPGDRALHRSLLEGSSACAVDLTGGGVLESAALVRRCRLFVTHDSGPMHIAAAMGVPVIAIFGPTNPERLAPRGPDHTVLFRPDEAGALAYDLHGRMPAGLPAPLPCLAAIRPEDVMDTIERRYRDRLLP